MKATIMLADFAQVVGGKLYIMGGGWSITGPNPTPYALAIKIEVPWNETNRDHSFKLNLLDTEHRQVLVPTPDGDKPMQVGGNFQVGRPPGLIQGSSLDVPLALNLPPLPLAPGARYLWQLMINDDQINVWEVAFSTRATAPQPTMS
jgi:hypothetical protein